MFFSSSTGIFQLAGWTPRVPEEIPWLPKTLKFVLWRFGPKKKSSFVSLSLLSLWRFVMLIGIGGS